MTDTTAKLRAAKKDPNQRPAMVWATDAPRWMQAIPSNILFGQAVARYCDDHGLPRPTGVDLASERLRRNRLAERARL